MARPKKNTQHKEGYYSDKGILPGDLTIWYKGEGSSNDTIDPPIHVALVSASDGKGHVKVIHPVSDLKFTGRHKELTGQGLRDSSLRDPYVSQELKRKEVFRLKDDLFKNERFSKQVFLKKVVEVLKKWNEAEVNYYHPSEQLQHQKKSGTVEEQLDYSQESFARRSHDMISRSVRSELFGVPVQPKMGWVVFMWLLQHFKRHGVN